MIYPFARGPIPPNDHYDGKKFFNPWEPSVAGFRNLLKAGIEIQSRQQPPWPKWRELQHFPSPMPRVTEGIQYTLINHATVLIQVAGINILTDPVFADRVSPVFFAGPRRIHRPAIAMEHLPQIDVVCVSHNHYDHLEHAALLQLEKKFQPLFITPLGNEIYLKKSGLKKVIELDWWESHSFCHLDEKVKFTLTPAQHFSSRGLHDRDQSLWGGFYIEGGGKAVFFAGDTGYAPFFNDIQKRLGPPHLSFLPIGAYEPRWFMRVIHMNPEDAVKAHQDLQSHHSVGIHFGCFRLTSEGVDDPALHLQQALGVKSLTEENFSVPLVGRVYARS